MKNIGILQKFPAEIGEKNLVCSRLLVEDVDFPDSLFDPEITVREQYCGVIPPIIVREKAPRYLVVDGCKRLVLLRRKKIKETTFVVINDCDDFSSSMLRILLNRGRMLVLREKMLFTKWLRDNLTDDEYRSFVSELGISDRERFELERLSECPINIMDAVEKGIADPAVVSDLKAMSKDDCDACLDFFSRVNLSRQQQRELVEWLPEIAFTETKTVCALLKESQITEVLENDSINQPQKAQKIRDLIFKKRFPDLAALKQKWSGMVNKINPDQARIHFNVSDAFEKNRLEVRIILEEAQKAVELISKLGSISKDTWEKLIYPGKQEQSK
jgi:hypothetical protein